MEEVLILNISELYPHPNQTTIYGEEKPDTEFIESIRDRGVMTPLIITPRKEGAYTIVSGHRRKEASKIAGLDSVPCIIRRYKTQEEMDLAHIELNRQREKSVKQKINEFIAWKQILRQDLQLIENKVVGIDDETANKLSLRRLNEIEIKEEKGKKRITDIIEESTGLSHWFQQNATIVFDDMYIGDKTDKFRKMGLSEEMIKKIYSFVTNLREEVKKGEISLAEAAKMIKSNNQEIEKRYKPKEKKVKTKAKTKKSKPKEDALFALFPVTNTLGYTYSQKPIKYDEANSVADFLIKTNKGNDAGIIKTKNQPTGFCIKIKGREEILMINIDELVKIMEKSL